MRGKKGWLRIVEAFMAVIIILGAVLVVNQRLRAPADGSGEEITRLERNILDFVRQDDELRGEVLAGDLSGVDKIANVMTPSGYSYAIRNCTVNPPDICSLEFYISGDVYTEDTLIVANLTYFVPEQAKKLKLFMWAGERPAGVQPPNYSKP